MRILLIASEPLWIDENIKDERAMNGEKLAKKSEPISKIAVKKKSEPSTTRNLNSGSEPNLLNVLLHF